jgi:hypothetical protein
MLMSTAMKEKEERAIIFRLSTTTRSRPTRAEQRANG